MKYAEDIFLFKKYRFLLKNKKKTLAPGKKNVKKKAKISYPII